MTFVIVDVSLGTGLGKEISRPHIRVRFTAQDSLSYPLSLLSSSYSRTHPQWRRLGLTQLSRCSSISTLIRK